MEIFTVYVGGYATKNRALNTMKFLNIGAKVLILIGDIVTLSGSNISIETEIGMTVFASTPSIRY
ncbi:MAG: hypothetical protein PQJ48_08910 [Sphaerochaetaceae bacterium]|nr:hypothetical protein [Sphaerochaetaceae bacterium]